MLFIFVLADIRHGGKGSYSTHSSSKSHQSSSSGHSSSSKCHSKSHSPSKSHSRSSHSKSYHSPNKSHRSHLPAMSPLKPINKDLMNSGLDNATVVTLMDGKSNLPTKASVKEPPHSLEAVTKVGAELDTDKVNDSKANVNNNLVVKVERMPDSVSKKHRDDRKALTNGSLRDSKSPPPTLSMPVITDIEDIKDIKLRDIRSDSPIPQLTAAHDNDNLYLEDMDTVPGSEIDNAVSSILEPVSPASEPEPGGFVNIVTSSSTITTNTVTMASITTSATSVTNVITTMSSFRFGSMGRPNIPMGSIRVNFSSSGVLNTIATDGQAVANVVNSNTNNSALCSAVKSSSPSDTNTSRSSSICSNGNMESTISDIVQSAVNSGITGGFQSLSPLSSSPPKSTSNLANKFHSSFKSPSKISPLVKSASVSSLQQKSGSKLGPGSLAVLKTNSGGSINSSSSGSSSGGGPVNTDAIKKFQLLNKPDKIIPLKGEWQTEVSDSVVHLCF